MRVRWDENKFIVGVIGDSDVHQNGGSIAGIRATDRDREVKLRGRLMTHERRAPQPDRQRKTENREDELERAASMFGRRHIVSPFHCGVAPVRLLRLLLHCAAASPQCASSKTPLPDMWKRRH